MKTQTYGLGDYNSVVHKIKSFPKVYKSKSESSVTLVQVAACKVKETHLEVNGGGGLHVAKLLWICGFFNV